MGRFRDEADDEGDLEIDISPLLDCVFILLIFFIVTTTFVEESGVDVVKERAVTAERLKKTSIFIAITEDNEVVYGGREIGISGVQPLVKRMLRKENVPVVVQPDLASDSSTLIRVLEEARLGEATDINVATEVGAG